MSIRIMSRVWDESPYEHSLLLVHLCLADISNDDGYCWPSVAWIAKKCRLDDRYTRKLLNQMVEDGLVEKGLREGKKNTNVYLVRSTPVKKDPLSILPPVKKDPLSPKTPNPSGTLTKESKAHGTMEELKAYAKERGFPESDGEYLFENWTDNGWTRGGVKIKDWKTAFRTWQLGGHLPSQRRNGKSPHSNGSKLSSEPSVLLSAPTREDYEKGRLQ